MNKVNIADARAHFSRYLARVEAGETITLCRRNRPIAEIRPIAAAREPRPVGIDQGMTVPDSFFEPLPEGMERAFGSGSGPERAGSGRKGAGSDPERSGSGAKRSGETEPSGSDPERTGGGPGLRRNKSIGGEQ